MPIGVIVNCISVLAGGVIGSALGQVLPNSLKEHLPTLFGMCSIAIGINSIIKAVSMTAVVLAILVGFTIGHLLHLEDWASRFFHRLVKTMHLGGDNIDMEFYITAVALFCCSGFGWYSTLTEGIAGDPNLLFSKAVLDRAGNMQGVLLIDLNYQIIDRLCADIQLGSRGYIYLIDQSGGILWHPQQDLIYAGLKEENVAEVLAAADGRTLSGKGRMRRLYVACASEATGWTAVGVAYTQELLRSQDRIYKTYLLIAAAALILALVFALQLSRSIAGPIRRLMQTMRRVEDGDLHVRSQVSSRTELGQLSDSFDHMIAKTAELMDERLRSEEQKRKSEWKALQAQIQPHFLYNTLDSIIWMSHAGRNAEVVEMTSALALLLRSSIGDGSDTNTLKKEIAHVRSYLTIQKMRYNEKLRYEIDLDPQTEDCLLPKLILQPLVENAIYHGIKVKQQGGTVRIESLLEEDRLLITVEDDGVGMTPEQLETILDKKESDAESTKIGVYNVNERLQLFFGPDAVMKYYSTPGVRTMVMLVLPIVRGKEEDSHAED